MSQSDLTSAEMHRVNLLIGVRIRERRKQLKWSQEDLGNRLGLAYQQIQKYEAGSNRVAACRLPEIARILEKPVSYFYGEPDDGGSVDTPAVADEVSEGIAALTSLPASPVRSGVVALLKSLAA